MLSLVSYDSSSDSEKSENSSSDSSDSEADEKVAPKISPTRAVLPSALGQLADSKSKGVLGNPYRDAEDAKIAALEKHVKMVENDDKITLKNGKKICWNYRKGR